jgi:hypothetical protein
VNFLEVFNVAFAIHAENVQYNLIKMEVDEAQPASHIFDPDKYRIFSQLKRDAKTDVLTSPPYAALDSTEPEHSDFGDALLD